MALSPKSEPYGDCVSVSDQPQGLQGQPMTQGARPRRLMAPPDHPHDTRQRPVLGSGPGGDETGRQRARATRPRSCWRRSPATCRTSPCAARRVGHDRPQARCQSPRISRVGPAARNGGKSRPQTQARCRRSGCEAKRRSRGSVARRRFDSWHVQTSMAACGSVQMVLRLHLRLLSSSIGWFSCSLGGTTSREWTARERIPAEHAEELRSIFSEPPMRLAGWSRALSKHAAAPMCYVPGNATPQNRRQAAAARLCAAIASAGASMLHI